MGNCKVALGVDPGTRNCGLAVVEDDGGMVARVKWSQTLVVPAWADSEIYLCDALLLIMDNWCLDIVGLEAFGPRFGISRKISCNMSSLVGAMRATVRYRRPSVELVVLDPGAKGHFARCPHWDMSEHAKDAALLALVALEKLCARLTGCPPVC